MVVTLLDALEIYSMPLFKEGHDPNVVEARANVASVMSDAKMLGGELAELVHRER